jgi:circadian clock protein KaiB
MKARLRLYVAGSGPNSLAAERNVRSSLDGDPRQEVLLEIVDVFEEPERALEDGVWVTPTLVRLEPGPVRRIVGSLDGPTDVLATLGLGSKP